MTSRYRVEYALKTHRRDELIEWIKGLLVVPFVLHAGPTVNELQTVDASRARYAEIFRDVEHLIDDKIYMDGQGLPAHARLKHLVPTIGHFFTRLPLERAFLVQDPRRAISARRLVSPSFNDIRLILNTAQAMALAEGPRALRLVTFDGDVTLYEDGMSLARSDDVVERLLCLLAKDIHVGIVTAAGYAEKSGANYIARLQGLVDAVRESRALTAAQKRNVYVVGGESNFMFRLDGARGALEWIDPVDWTLPAVKEWQEADILELLDTAQRVLGHSREHMGLEDSTEIVRKVRGVGIVPRPGHAVCREVLEELVLMAQKMLENTAVARRISFSAFNGGHDVWVDIGDKKLGVMSLQRYVGGRGGEDDDDLTGAQTLHVGDQFAPLGANDFKARMAACTVWIASPKETVQILDELAEYLDRRESAQDLDVPEDPVAVAARAAASRDFFRPYLDQ